MLARVIRLTAGPATASVVAEAGGRLGSLDVDGVELLVPGGSGDEPMTWGSFPMAPWAGRVRDAQFDFAGESWRLPCSLPPHAGHGTVFTQSWTRTDAGEDPSGAELACDLGPDWPLGGRAEQRIVLTPGAVHCTLVVVAGERAMPAELGWHPWFRTRGPIDLRARQMYERVGQLPTGRLVDPAPPPWDDCFVTSEPVCFPVGPLEVAVSSDCDHVVVFDGSDAGIAVEPQTGPPDAFHIAPRRLDPGQRLEATMTITWHRRS